jgi:hypothetical protein
MGFQTEMGKPWGHAAEYRRLRRVYTELGAALEASGVELGELREFASLAGEADDVTPEEADATPETTAVTESGPRNPFTGLEDWSIIVEEKEADTDGAALDEVLPAAPPALKFAFANEKGSAAGDGSDPDDIFATSG